VNLDTFCIPDEIYTISPSEGVIVTGTKIPRYSSIFEHHFPDFPVLPGIYLIEFIAQSAGHLTMASTSFTKMAVLAKVAHCKFSNFVAPGERLVCKIEKHKSEHGFTLSAATVRCGERIVCTAEIRMKIIDFPSERARDLLIAKFENLYPKVIAEDMAV